MGSATRVSFGRKFSALFISSFLRGGTMKLENKKFQKSEDINRKTQTLSLHHHHHLHN
jgi:hypothetical protein